VSKTETPYHLDHVGGNLVAFGASRPKLGALPTVSYDVSLVLCFTAVAR
jgi:hypothetical protein